MDTCHWESPPSSMVMVATPSANAKVLPEAGSLCQYPQSVSPKLKSPLPIMFTAGSMMMMFLETGSDASSPSFMVMAVRVAPAVRVNGPS